jgi:hypothetical protein
VPSLAAVGVLAPHWMMDDNKAFTKQYEKSIFHMTLSDQHGLTEKLNMKEDDSCSATDQLTNVQVHSPYTRQSSRGFLNLK